MSQALSMQRDWYPKVAGSRHTQTHTQEDGNQRTTIKMVLFFFFSPGLVPSDTLRVDNMLGKMWHGHVCWGGVDKGDKRSQMKEARKPEFR